MRHTAKKQGGLSTDYVRANDKTIARVKNGVTTFIHSDHLGSAQVGTDGSGLMTFQEYYTPFGEVINASAENDNQAGFTGHIRDTATGLNYMQARYYDPNIGRFLSIDPVDFISSGYDPRHFNRYAYAFNNPVNLTDSTGMSPLRDMYYSKMSTGGKLPAGMKPAGTPVTGTVRGDLLMTAGAAIVAFDVATIPSGEGAAGAAMITAAKSMATNAAVGAGTTVGLDVIGDVAETGQPDFSDLGQNIRDGAVDGVIGGSAAKQINKGLAKSSMGDLTGDAALKAVEPALDRVSSELVGAGTGAVLGSEIRESLRDDENP